MLRHVRLPLSLPLVMGGVRIAVIFCMGIVTLGGLVGAGGSARRSRRVSASGTRR